MKSIKLLLALLCLFLSAVSVSGQDLSQTIRGTILDLESKAPLIGANIIVLGTSPLLGTSTDLDGNFVIADVPIGRHNLEVQFIGYEKEVLNNILLTSGKEIILTVEMTESAVQMEEIVVRADEQVDKTKPLNAFATLSSRTFSVEETSRYAAASFDPARMAQNYAGVSVGNGSSDLFNEIIIRGNSPSGVLWRLEGVEIPNPNHFGSMGNSGGAISMLSSSTLSNSDFYTGAFPAEFGNATSGVFDLNMRNGNNEKREYSLMFGALGLEVAAEGPFSKKSRASYLFNYRYSTLALIQAVGINPTGDVLPTYQDLSFKVNIPTNKTGTWSLFGLGGNNLAAANPAKDSLEWLSENDKEGFRETSDVGTIGISNRKLLGDDSYIRTVAIGSFERTREEEFRLANDYSENVFFKDVVQQSTFRISSLYHKKFNAKNSGRLGVIASQKKFTFNSKDKETLDGPLVQQFDNEGSGLLLQSYLQAKHRFTNELTLNAGVHYTLFTFNNSMAIEPRLALSWQMNEKQRLSAAIGLHSKPEHLALYTFEGMLSNGREITAKKDMGLTKSMHAVLGYDYTINANMRVKAELYYQHLYNLPISTDPDNRYSILNAADIWDIIGLEDAVAEGTGRNIGIDLTLEKFFSSQYYYMLTGSIYDSKYTPQDGKLYNTRFNGKYQANIIGGKEFNVGKNKSNILGLNGKAVMSGGSRYTPIDLEASQAAGYTISYEDRPFEAKTKVYYRFDVGLSYRINRKRMTHTIMLDIQNVTNRANLFGLYYDDETNKLEEEEQTGLFPFFNYRIEF